MTKSHEAGRDYLTAEVRKEAQRTGEDPCAILRRRRREAKRQRDKELKQEIQRAEKYFGCRNKRKRGKRR